MAEYNSKKDTKKHIIRVNELMQQFVTKLLKRAFLHDKSKLEKEEKPYFDTYTPLLKKLTYNSKEYKESLQKLQVALDHHYKNNSHHPEHYKNGVDDMDLIDVFEMFVDWKAATERHEDGDIYKSIKSNKDRFKISEQLCKIFENTAKNFEWEK